jgi:TetR/AcrR family transcriptional regulator, transcriptional repressor for nem operon
MSEPRRIDAAERILDTAQQLAQTCGFNGFSYADIALRLGVTKASLHYHFPSKAELGRALIARYRERFVEALAAIDQQGGKAPRKLRNYVALYHQVMHLDRMCLCGMFAAEYATLPPAMQEELRHFFDANELWLSGVLERGRSAREIAFRESPRERARVLVGTLEGAMLLARAYGDDKRFQGVARHLLTELAPGLPARPPAATRTAPPS